MALGDLLVGDIAYNICFYVICGFLSDIDVDSPAMFERLSQIPLKANNYQCSTEMAFDQFTSKRIEVLADRLS